MRPDLILFRTAKGEDVAQGRGHEISANHRRALLVVDGKTSVANIAKKVFWVSDVVSVLQELYALELIHDDVSTIQGEVSQTGGAGLLLKIKLAALAKELLRDNANRIIKKIEEADGTPAALEDALLACKKIIKLTISDDLADTFLLRGREIIGK